MTRLSARLLCLAALLLSSCSWLLPEPDRTLRLEEPAVYTMESYDGKKTVTMQVVPGKEQALAADIVQLEGIEREAMREFVALGGSGPLILPAYGYELCCFLREGEGEAKKCSFMVRRGSFISRATVYGFDAREYFTPESWDAVRRELYDEEYDGETDELLKDYSFEPLPPRETPAES